MYHCLSVYLAVDLSINLMIYLYFYHYLSIYLSPSLSPAGVSVNANVCICLSNPVSLKSLQRAVSILSAIVFIRASIAMPSPYALPCS